MQQDWGKDRNQNSLRLWRMMRVDGETINNLLIWKENWEIENAGKISNKLYSNHSMLWSVGVTMQYMIDGDEIISKFTKSYIINISKYNLIYLSNVYSYKY